MNVYRVALTGQSCAGKTKVIEALPKKLEEMGLIKFSNMNQLHLLIKGIIID